jgi:hypothetical protein
MPHCPALAKSTRSRDTCTSIWTRPVSTYADFGGRRVSDYSGICGRICALLHTFTLWRWQHFWFGRHFNVEGVIRTNLTRRCLFRSSLAAGALLASPAICRRVFAASKTGSFEALNAMRFRDMPEFTSLGLKDVRVVYTSELWPKKVSKVEPNLDFIATKAIPRIRADRPDRIIIDIEHWPLAEVDDAKAKRNIDRYMSVIDTFRQHMPETKVGYYGTVPTRNYWAPVKKDTAAIATWRNDNKRLAPLAEALDTIYPSLYTFYDDVPGWTTYALANIEEARQYGKPIYPFLWPQYHRSRKPIAGDFWRLQLDTVFKNADGVVIWTPARGGPKWDPDTPWWHHTVDFLKSTAAN